MSKPHLIISPLTPAEVSRKLETRFETVMDHHKPAKGHHLIQVDETEFELYDQFDTQWGTMKLEPCEHGTELSISLSSGNAGKILPLTYLLSIGMIVHGLTSGAAGLCVGAIGLAIFSTIMALVIGIRDSQALFKSLNVICENEQLDEGDRVVQKKLDSPQD